MIEATKEISVPVIVKRLREDSGGLDFEPAEARLFIKTLRALAEGSPITAENAAQIADEVNIPMQTANEVLNWLAERDDDGDIVGLAGLSLGEWSHRFKVNGRDLTTWCALDTLYLPPLLDQIAQIESPDPLTQEAIRVTVGSEGVEQYSPSSAVISIVVPKIKEKGLESAEEIWTAFCNYSLSTSPPGHRPKNGSKKNPWSPSSSRSMRVFKSQGTGWLRMCSLRLPEHLGTHFHAVATVNARPVGRFRPQPHRRWIAGVWHA